MMKRQLPIPISRAEIDVLFLLLFSITLPYPTLDPPSAISTYTLALNFHPVMDTLHAPTVNAAAATAVPAQICAPR